MEFDMNKKVTVTNRSCGTVGYRIPDQNIRRIFNIGETKTLPYQELVWLSDQPGGRDLMSNFLLIAEAEATKTLEIHTEPEYFLSEAQVIDLMQNGSIDEFLDALDFAPTGVIEIIKSKAVSLPLNDMAKREAIFKATGFDVTKAIENNKPDADEEPVEEKATQGRRVQKTSEPTRRYKVIEE